MVREGGRWRVTYIAMSERVAIMVERSGGLRLGKRPTPTCAVQCPRREWWLGVAALRLRLLPPARRRTTSVAVQRSIS